MSDRRFKLPDGWAVLREPFPKQRAFIQCPADETFFGGARGPGKTDGFLLDWLVHAERHGAHAKGLLVRRELTQLAEIIDRTMDLFTKVGGIYHVQPKVWRFSNGARLRLSQVYDEADALKYHGHEYSWLGVEELPNWPDMKPIDLLKACLRSPHGIQCLFRANGNPGGPGHNQVKQRYIDPAPEGMRIFRACGICDAPFQNGDFVCKCDPKLRAHVERCYIPATLDDNPILRDDPQYWRELVAATAGNEALLKAWRYGLWDIVAGGMFSDLFRREAHVIEPFTVPDNWHVYRALDYGDSKPFCVHIVAEANGEEVATPAGKRAFPRGSKFVIAEDYGWTGKANHGLNLTSSEIAQRVIELQQGVKQAGWFKGSVAVGPGDIPQNADGHSPLEVFNRKGVRFVLPDKSKGSRAAGWQTVRMMLKAALDQAHDQPHLYFFKGQCEHGVLRTIAVAQRDPAKLDDINDKGEDHALDTLRYGVSKRSSGPSKLGVAYA